MSTLKTFDDSVESGDINVWSSMVDLIMALLMVFLLFNLLQTFFSLDSLEAAQQRQQQEHFLREFQAEFDTEINGGLIEIERHIDFLQITFSEGALFLSTRYELLSEGKMLLSRCAHLFSNLEPTTYRQIQVEGHTDDRTFRGAKYPTDNWELSTARALSVVHYLMEQGQLAPDRFSATGYAQYRPISTNDTLEGQARNRRIEIRLFFAGIRRNTSVKPPGGQLP